MSATNTPEDIVQAFTSALETNNLTGAASYMSDDFLFSGWTPLPLDKAGFLAVIQGLKSGIPGLLFNLQDVQVQHGTVTGTIRVTGYQSDSFILPTLGLPPIPQMAGHIALQSEKISYTLVNELISKVYVQSGLEGGIRGILRQLGTDAPIVQ